jgi:dTDP-4-amino-4,6-dideoxygalactose transaminase
MDSKLCERTAIRKLALNGAPAAVPVNHGRIFKWPIITSEDEDAVLEILRAGTMSGTAVTRLFESEFAEYLGVRYALGCCNGTAAIQEAMWACGVGLGDEVICPSMTYWASCTAALALGATVNFADIDPETLCINPSDIEHRIGADTKAIIVVHYAGHPCDMDRIMEIARRHDVKVIEDVSHAVGSRYKERYCGTIGDIAGMSMMAGKSFVVGEGGMVTTNDRELYERCMAFGHYERIVNSRFSGASEKLFNPELLRYAGVPQGGVKHRLNQTCSALGRVQLKYYPERIEEIQQAMNYFWEQLRGYPGLHPHRVASETDSTMGGWYYPRGLYRAGELGGLSCAKFCRAVTAEGFNCSPGANFPLHLHPAFHEMDVLHAGAPSMVAFAKRDMRQGSGSLPVSERIGDICLGVPWFKHCDHRIIKEYVDIFKKVIEHHRELL